MEVFRMTIRRRRVVSSKRTISRKRRWGLRHPFRVVAEEEWVMVEDLDMVDGGGGRLSSIIPSQLQ